MAFRLDPCVLDGRFANNGWLQELPKPITKLTWDNAIFVSPATEQKLRGSNQPAYRGGEHGTITSDVFELRAGGRTIRGPLFNVVGHADDCATVHLGYGRTRGGHTAIGAGFDPNVLRTSGSLASLNGASLVKTGDTFALACTQYHHLMEGRDIIRAATREEYVRDPKVMREHDETPGRFITLYPEHEYKGHKWGMAIDVNSCMGCNACVVGCQAENNIAIVGKDQVLRGREMHWIRVDSLLPRRNREPGNLLSAAAVSAVRERPVRTGLPGGCDRAQSSKG